jgi:hypothetical protein
MGAVALRPKLGKPFRQDTEGTTATSAVRAHAGPAQPATNVSVVPFSAGVHSGALLLLLVLMTTNA